MALEGEAVVSRVSLRIYRSALLVGELATKVLVPWVVTIGLEWMREVRTDSCILTARTEMSDAIVVSVARSCHTQI